VRSGDHVLGGVSESDLVVTKHLTAQHREHLWSGTLYDSNACKQSWPRVEWQDRLCRCGQILLLLGNDIVEIGNDGAKHL